VGGEITTSGVTTKPTASAFIIKLDPCPPASSFKSVHEETLQARLKELSKGKFCSFPSIIAQMLVTWKYLQNMPERGKLKYSTVVFGSRLQ